MVSARLDRSVGAVVFGTDTGGYDSGRLGYPAELFDLIEDRAGLIAGKRLFEAGAGSGIATRDLLARNPGKLVAIEPDADFAAAMRGWNDPRLSVVTSTFEDAPIGDAAFDLGAAVSCLHWMDEARAFERAYRALQQGGWWAVWWNVYRQTGIGDPAADRIVAMLDGIALPPSEAPSGHYALDEARHRAALAAAGFVEVEYRLFRRERTLTADQYRALYTSYSFVRVMAPDARVRLLDAIAAMVERDFGDCAPNVVLTPLYLARKPG